jgi:hypothetical protein
MNKKIPLAIRGLFGILGVLGILTPLISSTTSQAYYYRYPRGYYGYYRPYNYYNYPGYYYSPYTYYYPWYNTSCYYGGYGCRYYLENTDSNFRTGTSSEEQSPQLEQLYLRAAEDASRYLQNGDEPSAVLREAIRTERDIATKSGLDEARSFDDQTIAQIILSRVERLTTPEGERNSTR